MQECGRPTVSPVVPWPSSATSPETSWPGMWRRHRPVTFAVGNAGGSLRTGQISARRPDIDTPSPPTPRSTSPMDTEVIVGSFGRGAPPAAHGDGRSQKCGPRWHTIAAPGPVRLAGILHRRPKTTTRHPVNNASSHRRHPSSRCSASQAQRCLSVRQPLRRPHRPRRPDQANPATNWLCSAVSTAPG